MHTIIMQHKGISMEKAAFKLDTYRFTKASLNFNIQEKAELDVSFNPKGLFNDKEACYNLYFDVTIEYKKTNTKVIEVSCEASFSFAESLSINDIPDFFYPNSLAIIFPYIRAFVSTLSLQANVRPIVLPTINLSGLKQELKNNTKVIE